MSPDDPLDRIDRRVEGLYVSYGALEKAQAVTDERVDTNADNISAIRADMKELRTDMLAAVGRSEQRTRDLVTGVKASCDKGWAEINTWVEQYERDEKAKRERDADRAERSLVSRRQVTIGVIALVLTALGMIMTLLIVLLGGGT
jgi:hypothetical protein